MVTQPGQEKDLPSIHTPQCPTQATPWELPLGIKASGTGQSNFDFTGKGILLRPEVEVKADNLSGATLLEETSVTFHGKGLTSLLKPFCGHVLLGLPFFFKVYF